MSITKKIIAAAALLLLAACSNYEDFEFTGKVVDYEQCTSGSIGYAVSLTSPDTIGGVAYISCFIHLSGTRLSTQPTKPGLYINSRHKVVIK